MKRANVTSIFKRYVYQTHTSPQSRTFANTVQHPAVGTGPDGTSSSCRDVGHSRGRLSCISATTILLNAPGVSEIHNNPTIDTNIIIILHFYQTLNTCSRFLFTFVMSSCNDPLNGLCSPIVRRFPSDYLLKRSCSDTCMNL